MECMVNALPRNTDQSYGFHTQELITALGMLTSSVIRLALEDEDERMELTEGYCETLKKAVALN